jgi:rubrerythrin
MEMILLNKNQTAQARALLGIYKKFYVCNECGNFYGADFLEIKDRMCPPCEVKKEKERRKK